VPSRLSGSGPERLLSCEKGEQERRAPSERLSHGRFLFEDALLKNWRDPFELEARTGTRERSGGFQLGADFWREPGWELATGSRLGASLWDWTRALAGGSTGNITPALGLCWSRVPGMRGPR